MLWTKASKPTALSITESGFLDLSQTSLSSDYPHTYIKVLDNLFTPEECASLVSLAESGTKDGWETAKISTFGGDVVDLDYRNSDRILRFDHETADWIYQRLLPHIQDLVEIKAGDEWENVVGPRGQTTGTWKLVGLNERLSFLKYGPGHYFKPHYDGKLELPDGRRARVTIQIYFNEEGLKGGATRILGQNKKHYLDIVPKLGRVLIFQNRGVFHSGEEVTEGLKYAVRSDLMYRHVTD